MSSPTVQQKAFSEREAAQMYGLSPKTLQAWRINGGGPRFLKMGKAIRYLASDLAEFEAQSKRESTAQQ